MRKPWFRLVIWDTQAGVVIEEFSQDTANIMFYGDKTKITYITINLDLYIYDALDGTQLCLGKIPLWDTEICAHWTHNNALQFATSSKTNGKLVINIYELQPTITPPLQLLYSFPILPHSGKFSFSPVSFHASFVTETDVLILNIQDSKILLQTLAYQEHGVKPGQFSPNGCFFACGVSGNMICVWQNTPAGYVPWSSLRPRLSHQGFSWSWSPTSISILCWGSRGIELLHPDNCFSSVSSNKDKSHLYGKHLVVYSADQTYIATTQKRSSVVTVLDHHLGIPQQTINTEMKILDMKIINDTIFIVDEYKLASWDLKAGRTVHSFCDAGVVVFDEPLTISHYGGYLALSHDCSQIIFTNEGGSISLHNVKDSKTTTKDIGFSSIYDLRLSPNQHRLLLLKQNNLQAFHTHLELDFKVEGFGNMTKMYLRSEWMWANYFSLHGYHVQEDSEWIIDSEGHKLLWLPPNWRIKDWRDVRWDGKFLALIGHHHLEPLVVEFKT